MPPAWLPRTTERLPFLCFPLPAKQQEPTFPLPSRWLTQKGARQKKINEWLGIKNETEE